MGDADLDRTIRTEAHAPDWASVVALARRVRVLLRSEVWAPQSGSGA
jgi:hypothetical protein